MIPKFMNAPNFQSLTLAKDTGVSCLSFAMPMHENPHYYKYRWWVFHRESPCEGREFLDRKHSLCTADAMTLMARLQEEKEPYILYNEQQPRLPVDGLSPWDVTAKRWKNANWAPNLAQDIDPEWKGYK